MVRVLKGIVPVFASTLTDVEVSDVDLICVDTVDEYLQKAKSVQTPEELRTLLASHTAGIHRTTMRESVESMRVDLAMLYESCLTSDQIHGF